MKPVDIYLASDYSKPEIFAIHVQVTTNVVGCFIKHGTESKPRREAFTEEAWQRVEWASRALLDALSEAKPIASKKPKHLAPVIKLPKSVSASHQPGHVAGVKQEK